MNLALIEWTTDIQKKANWKDREYGIYDEDYTTTRTLKIFKIPVFKKRYVFEVQHEIKEFGRSTVVKGLVGG